MDYSVRSGDRADLVATLRQLALDRGERGQSERAADASHAAEVLESGGEGAYYDRVIYVVGESDRWSVIGGTRDEVEAQLHDAADGWRHQGRPELARQAWDALASLRSGADVVRVGHLLYAVRV